MHKYRRNLTEYWQQFYPLWQVPAGYHVHHIKPKCTFEDKTDPRMHHASNLIALHPDDHVSIHKCRGDKFVNGGTLTIIAGRPQTEERKKKISATLKEQYASGKRVTVRGMLGKKMPESAKKAIGNALRGVPKSADHARKLAEANLGRKWYNNGQVTRMFRPGTEEAGFKLGRGIQ